MKNKPFGHQIEAAVEPVIPERRPELWAVVYRHKGVWRLIFPVSNRNECNNEFAFIVRCSTDVSIIHITADPGSGEKK